jgi:hypothetical protein
LGSMEKLLTPDLGIQQVKEVEGPTRFSTINPIDITI